ncbi:MAG: class I SAM-dependent methyltransferase, partial [Candidatus Diapherotrites archaeon]|nr:class I SAM-dependent methyltransferase [Candidatus Diapherotrites archaeon]
LHIQRTNKVVAIDSSPLAIQVCRARGIEDARVLDFEHIDNLKERFDTVLMLGNNFGLLGSLDKAKKQLAKLYSITNPGAIIIAESKDPYQTDDPVHLDYHKKNKQKRRMSGQLRIRIRYRTYISDWFDYLFASETEVEQIVSNTLWKIEKVFKSENGMFVAILRRD